MAAARLLKLLYLFAVMIWGLRGKPSGISKAAERTVFGARQPGRECTDSECECLRMHASRALLGRVPFLSSADSLRPRAHAVPLYDSLGESAVEYTVNHSATALVFVQASKLGLLAKAVPKVKGSLKAVVVWGGSDAAAEAAVRKEVQSALPCCGWSRNCSALCEALFMSIGQLAFWEFLELKLGFIKGFENPG